jgi:hypothetical protein
VASDSQWHSHKNLRVIYNPKTPLGGSFASTRMTIITGRSWQRLRSHNRYQQHSAGSHDERRVVIVSMYICGAPRFLRTSISLGTNHLLRPLIHMTTHNKNKYIRASSNISNHSCGVQRSSSPASGYSELQSVPGV